MAEETHLSLSGYSVADHAAAMRGKQEHAATNGTDGVQEMHGLGGENKGGRYGVIWKCHNRYDQCVTEAQ